MILATLMIGLCIFFIRNEHLELLTIKETLVNTQFWPIVLGIALTFVFVLLQALMYYFSFRALGKPISLSSGILLYLKRNLVSVFLPAGGFSSLAFFSGILAKHHISQTNNYFGSYLYALSGLVSVVFIAIPVLLYVMLGRDLTSQEITPFMGLMAMVALLGYAGRSLLKKGFVFRLLQRYKPDLILVLEDLQAQNFRKTDFLWVNVCSLGIELVGIVHIYVCMQALGLEPSWEVAAVSYVIMIMLLVASPFLRGMGAIEFSMTYVFISYGYTTVIAAAITLLFRFFEFWLPLAFGLFSFIKPRDLYSQRIIGALLVFVLALTNLFLTLSPVAPDSEAQWLAKAVAFLLPMAGFMLMLVSLHLIRGVKLAWWFAFLVAAGSCLAYATMEPVRFEAALFAGLLAVFLAITHQSYTFDPDPRFSEHSLGAVTVSFVGLLCYGIIGFYYLDETHFGINFDLGQTLKSLSGILFLFNTGNLNPLTPFGQAFLFSIYAAWAGVLVFGAITTFRPFYRNKVVVPEDFQMAGQLASQVADSPWVRLKVSADKTLFFSENGQGFCAFRLSLPYTVVLEGPVCKPGISVPQFIQEFQRYGHSNNLKPIFHLVPAHSLNHYLAAGLKALPIARELTLDLQGADPLESTGNWTLWKEPVTKAQRANLLRIAANWQKMQQYTEKGFSQLPPGHASFRQSPILFFHPANNQLQGYAQVLPDQTHTHWALGGIAWEAPYTSTEVLRALIEAAQKEKIHSLSLGFFPLADAEKPATERRTKAYARHTFTQLDIFQAPVAPPLPFTTSKTLRYIVYEHDYDLIHLPRVLADIHRTR